MDRIVRAPDANLMQRIQRVDGAGRSLRHPFRPNISNEQKSLEKARIVISEVNHLADEATRAVTWFDNKKAELRQEYRGVQQFAQQQLAANPGGLPPNVEDYMNKCRREIADDIKTVEKMEFDYQKHCATMLHNHYRTFFALKEARDAQHAQMRHDLIFGTIRALNSMHIHSDALKDLFKSIMKIAIEGKI